MRTIFRLFMLLSAMAVSPPLLLAESSSVTLSASRDIMTDDSSVEIRYSVSVPETLETQGSGIKKITIPGFGMEITEGKPLLPVRIDYVEIPTGCEYSVTTELSDSLVLSCDIEPAQPLMTDSDVKNPDFVRMENYPGFYPRMNVESLTPQIYRDRSIAPIRVYPMRYSQESKSLIIYRKICYKVEFDQGTQTRQASANKDSVHSIDETFNNFVISLDIANDEYLTRYSIIGDKLNPRRAPDYLVLTTSEYENLLKHDFLPWKQKMGFNVHIAADDSWTPDKIKETVKSYYSQYPKLEYLLLFGNNECLPAYSRFHGYNRNNYVTDYPYVCMDGDDDLLADIYCGRIPIDNMVEARTVINNILMYEKNPPAKEDFYNTGVHVIDSTTIDENKNSSQFSGAACEIAKYLDLNFEKITVENTEPSGGFYVLYRGHGYNDGWAKPSFRISDIPRLNNSDQLPFVFNLTCDSGMFGSTTYSAPYKKETCFAKELLTYSNGGCIVNFSGTYTGYTRMNEGLSKGIFNAIWPSPGIYMTSEDTYGEFYNENYTSFRSPSYRAGQILEQAKKTLSEYYFDNKGYENAWNYACETIHCFGDPTVMIYTEQPFKISPKTTLSSSPLTFDKNVTCVYRTSVEGDIYLSNGSTSGYPLIAAVAHNGIPYIPNNTLNPILNTDPMEVSITVTDSETLNISYNEEYGSVAETAVYDIVGNRKNTTPNFFDNNISINVRNLAKGIYMLSVTMSDDRVITKSFTR